MRKSLETVLEQCHGCYWFTGSGCAFDSHLMVGACAYRYVRMVDEKEIPLGKRLKVLFFGKARLFNRRGLEYYLARCPVHGYYVTYPQGYRQELRCPMCILESFRK